MEHRIDWLRILEQAYNGTLKKVEELKGPRLKTICKDCIEQEVYKNT